MFILSNYMNRIIQPLCSCARANRVRWQAKKKKKLKLWTLTALRIWNLLSGRMLTQCTFLYDTHISEQRVPTSSEHSLIYPRDTNSSTFLWSLNPHLPNHMTTWTRTMLLALTFPDYNGTYLENVPCVCNSLWIRLTSYLFPHLKNNIPWASLQHYVKGRTVCHQSLIHSFVIKRGSYKNHQFLYCGRSYYPSLKNEPSAHSSSAAFPCHTQTTISLCQPDITKITYKRRQQMYI